MKEIDPYVEDNILLFADQHRWETNPPCQEALKRLLISEQRQIAREERLQLAERLLRDNADIIARQARRIAEMKGNGVDTGNAERRLQTFETNQLLFEEFHATAAHLGTAMSEAVRRGGHGGDPFSLAKR
jgi:hypothetical protein